MDVTLSTSIAKTFKTFCFFAWSPIIFIFPNNNEQSRKPISKSSGATFLVLCYLLQVLILSLTKPLTLFSIHNCFQSHALKRITVPSFCDNPAILLLDPFNYYSLSLSDLLNILLVVSISLFEITLGSQPVPKVLHSFDIQNSVSACLQIWLHVCNNVAKSLQQILRRTLNKLTTFVCQTRNDGEI